MTTDYAAADRQVDALELAALLHKAASKALIADRTQIRRALVYARRILLELDEHAGAR